MNDSIFSSQSRTLILKLLYCDELATFFTAINDYNVLIDPKTEEVVEAPEDPCDLAILVLLALRNIRGKKLHSDFRLTSKQINEAILDMHSYWFKLCMCSYSYKQIMEKGEKFYEREDPKHNYTRIAYHIFMNMLFVLGDVEKEDIHHLYEWSNKDELKDSLFKILRHPTLLDHLPTDIMAILNKEYYTLKYEDYQVEKALVSWFDIVNSITEDQLDDIKAIKYFINEALENSTLPRWTNAAIKEQFKTKIKNIKDSQITPTSMHFDGDYIAGDKKVEYEIGKVGAGGIGAQITKENNQ